MTRKPNDMIHCVNQEWGGKPAPKPSGSCQRTVVVRDADNRLKARVCRKPAKGQLCKSCEAKAEAVQRTARYVNPYREIWGSKA